MTEYQTQLFEYLVWLLSKCVIRTTVNYKHHRSYNFTWEDLDFSIMHKEGLHFVIYFGNKGDYGKLFEDLTSGLYNTPEFEQEILNYLKLLYG